jgi:RNA polymerase sigma-70 factor (ECF subfamily)
VTDRHIEKLIARASRGDAAAFGRLYDLYVDRVFAFARSRVRTVQDAEDLTEVAFTKAWQAIGSYDDRGLPFTAWLFRIARNAVIDCHRKSERQPETVDISAAAALPDSLRVEDEVIMRLDSEQVRAALRELTEEQASVIIMRFMWDLSLKDVADALGKTEGAVKAMQHRAVRSLATLLGKEADEDDS